MGKATANDSWEYASLTLTTERLAHTRAQLFDILWLRYYVILLFIGIIIEPLIVLFNVDGRRLADMIANTYVAQDE